MSEDSVPQVMVSADEFNDLAGKLDAAEEKVDSPESKNNSKTPTHRSNAQIMQAVIIKIRFRIKTIPQNLKYRNGLKL